MKNVLNESISHASQDEWGMWNDSHHINPVKTVNTSLIYLDNNATTKIFPEVLEEMLPVLQEKYGNPSSSHTLGKKAKQLLETARQRAASFLNCKSDHIIFTSGGTESNNLAIIGFTQTLESEGHFITSNVEHPAVMEVFRSLERKGHPVTYLPVDREGLIFPEQLEEAITPETKLISLMMANNETGVLFPIKELVQIARKHGILFHCDAVQGAGKNPIHVDELEVDFLTISGHKMYGPKGVGALFVRDMNMIEPIILGGGQEKGKRSGTEGLPGIVGLGKACEIAMQTMPRYIPLVAVLRDRLEQGILDLIPNSHINGNRTLRVCNTSNISFPGTQNAVLIRGLSHAGIYVSAGSACSACHGGNSYVLKAMGLSNSEIDASLRFSLSKENTDDDVDKLLQVMPGTLKNSQESVNSEKGCPVCSVAAAGVTEDKEDILFDVRMIPGLKKLQDETTGDPGVSIAVLDGMVDLDHPCFHGAQLFQVDSLASVGVGEVSQHGTHVASIIFGQPGTSVQGIAPRCKGLILPIYKEINGGLKPCSQLDLARAITRAVELGADIINISGGQLDVEGETEIYLTRAIELCVKSNVLIISAAGNNGCNCHHVPASMPDVLTVGAMNVQGEPMKFSNWGEKYLSHGVLAPGDTIRGAKPGGGITYNSGTSYATPIVSGIITLLMSIQKKRGEKPNPYRIKDTLLLGATPCNSREKDNCQRFLTGQLNVENAYELLFGAKDTGGNPSHKMVITASHPEKNESLHNKSNYKGGKIMSELNLNETKASVVTETMGSAQQKILGKEAAKNVQAAEYEKVEPGQTGTQMKEVASELEELKTGSVLPSQADGGCTTCGSAGKLNPSVGSYAPRISGIIQKVYALGTLGYDFGFEARRDNIVQNMEPGSNPFDVKQILSHLEENPWDAGAIIWTLELNTTPIYAILPTGPFAQDGYKLLAQYLKLQVEQGSERVSLPGMISGSARLMNGLEVPVVLPDIRGMYTWKTKDLVESVAGKVLKGEEEKYAEKAEGIRNLLDRIYYDIQNLGMSGHDRALNFAATNAFNVEKIFEKAHKKKFQLMGISTQKSPTCRPDSECWDVLLTFFDPENRHKRAKQVYRYTVDVSDTLPATVGPIRSWNEY